MYLIMNTEPLTEDELDFVDAILLAYGQEGSIVDASELDGFLTAIVSGPDMIMPSQWFPALWGGAGKEPEWHDEREMNVFMTLLMQHMNNNVMMLMECPDEFEALFSYRKTDKGTVHIVEEWCFGYMRGVELGNWPALPEAEHEHLQEIALHGSSEYFGVLDTMTLEEHQQTIVEIEPAARALHRYFLEQRSSPSMGEMRGASSMMPPHLSGQSSKRAGPKVGRNEPCPCGSGKKFKQCCLH